MRHLARQVVSVESAGLKNVYGKPTYATAVEFHARVEPVNEITATETAETATITADVFIPGDADIALEDRVTLPDGSTPTIVAVHKVTAGDGSIYYTKVRCS